MNLVISGSIDESFRNAIFSLTKPHRVQRLHARAFRFEGAESTTDIRSAVRGACENANVDHAYVAPNVHFSKFKLLAIDMDSTLITIECIDEVADFAGKKAQVAAITEAAMRGEIADFSESLRRRVALLKGVDVQALAKVYQERLILSEGAELLLATAKRYGLYTLLVSGGFTYFTEHLKQRLNFDAAFANVLEIKSGHLTGKVTNPIFDSSAKATAVSSAMMMLHTDAAHTIAIGDGSNDIQMMSNVGTSIAYHAKPTTREAASAEVNYGGLNVILDYYAD